LCHDGAVPEALLERYLAGEVIAVWDEVCRRNDSSPDVESGADEMMRRVARNVDLIVERLDAAGWRWAYPDMRRRAADEEDAQAVAVIEEAVGRLPLALRACLSRVGEVWLCGSHPSWSPPAYAFDDLPGDPVMADPLVLPSAKWMLEELRQWDDDEWCQPKRPWRFVLAPDELHKANISGGTHDVLLPTADADPVIVGVNQRRGVSLVTYLRVSLGFGGFPGFQFASSTPWLTADIARDLTPF
jgi:hypothetical protein